MDVPGPSSQIAALSGFSFRRQHQMGRARRIVVGWGRRGNALEFGLSFVVDLPGDHLSQSTTHSYVCMSLPVLKPSFGDLVGFSMSPRQRSSFRMQLQVPLATRPLGPGTVTSLQSERGRLPTNVPWPGQVPGAPAPGHFRSGTLSRVASLY